MELKKWIPFFQGRWFSAVIKTKFCMWLSKILWCDVIPILTHSVQFCDDLKSIWWVYDAALNSKNSGLFFFNISFWKAMCVNSRFWFPQITKVTKHSPTILSKNARMSIDAKPCRHCLKNKKRISKTILIDHIILWFYYEKFWILRILW